MNKNIIKNLLIELKELSLKNGDGIYGDQNIALEDIDSILNSKNFYNKEEINFLIAPTSNIQELSIDCNWGEEFLLITNKIKNYAKLR